VANEKREIKENLSSSVFIRIHNILRRNELVNKLYLNKEYQQQNNNNNNNNPKLSAL
jgi:hypothetical protein